MTLAARIERCAVALAASMVLACALALAATGAAFARPSGDGPAGSAPAVTPVGFDESAFARALAEHDVACENGVGAPAPLDGARVVVVPHHWPAGSLIVEALRRLAATGQGARGGCSPDGATHTHSWRRVVLLGLDHHGAGQRAVMTSDRPWLTPFGRVESDSQAVAVLASDRRLVALQPRGLAHEHSVATLVPALAYHLPGTRVVPLATRPDMDPQHVARLATSVVRLMDQHTITVVSVDFAHDLPPAHTRAMDAESLLALQRLDARRVMSFGDEHIDGRAAMATAMTVARALGARNFVPLSRTDGGELWGYAGGNVTSFVSGYYTAR